MDPGVLIVGAGQAGLQLAVSLREDGYDGPIRLVGNEALLPYQRPPLSKGLLSGTVAGDELFLEDESFFARAAIDFVANDHAIRVDRARRRLVLSSGRELTYGKLVFATGARNRALACAPAPISGVVSLRSLADAQRLRHRLKEARSLVVVGAGFVGLEVASVAVDLGISVVVVEAAASAMQRVLSPLAAEALTRHHRERGVQFVFGRCVTRVRDVGGQVDQVELDDGQVLDADLVLLAIGVVPNAELAGAAGLEVSNGIVVDETLRTSDADIYAIGDCAAFRSGSEWLRLESVQSAVDQARFVSRHLTGCADGFSQVPLFWSDQGGLRVQIAGVAKREDESVVRGDPTSPAFAVYRFRNACLTAVEAINRPAEVQMGRRLIARAIHPTAAQVRDPAFDLKSLVD